MVHKAFSGSKGPTTVLPTRVALSVAFLLASSGVGLAVPAAPNVHTLRQPDGRSFEARQWGDEWLSGWETTEGYTIVLDADSQVWAYAERTPRGTLTASAKEVGRDAPPEGSSRHLRPAGTVRERAHAMRASAMAVAGKASVPPTGTANVPVLLINFSDTTTTYTASDFTNLLFGNGNWSMRDYYKEVSYNRFTVSAGPGGVAGWYRASNTHDYYGANNAEGKDSWPGDLVYEAVQAADAAGFNFAPYDSDGDCYVDLVDIVHQGAGAEVEGNPETNIWSHHWTLYSAQYYGRSHYGVYTTNDVCPAGGYIKVNSYVIEPETYGAGMTTMGVFAHEFAHALGVPDLYDTDDSSDGVGEWSLMAAGSWGGVSRGGDRPSHLDAWGKAKLGWVTPHQVTGTLTGEAISQAETSADVYQLLAGTPGQTGEYFLVENRQPVNFDAGLPGSGLLIWHIDEARATDDNTDNADECYPGGPLCESQHYRVAVEQADNLWDLEKKTNSGNAGDPFPGSSGNRSFNGSTSPSSALYSGQASGVSIASISNPGATMTATLAVGAPGGGGESTIFSDNFEGSFPGSWRVTAATTTQWGKVTCKSSSGSGSAWCAAGGSAPQPACGQYVGNMNTWLTYGPFSLADATEASAEFDVWYDTEAYNQSTGEGDRFWWVISVNGTDYSGYYISGTSGGWTHKVFNFKDVTSFAAVGNATVWFAFAFNSDAYVQGGGAFVDNVVVKKTVATSCTYSISPPSQSFSNAAGTGTVNVTAGSGCSWTASSGAAWVSITSGASGTGNGTVGFSVQANTGLTRSSTLTIAGQTFTVSQAGVSCSYSISPTSASATAGGGTGSFNVTAGGGCAWTASSDSSWLHVTSGASGSGSGTVSYSVDANGSAARSGHVTVQGQTFTLSQSGTSVSLPYSHWIAAASHVDGAGGSHWRSDVAVLNTSSSAATIEYRLYTSGGQVTQQVVLAAKAQDLRRDIAAWLGYTTGSGALEVRSSQDVFVMGRTYNQVDTTHTFGQNYDGQDTGSSLLSAAQSAWLPLLSQNSSFRCNIAITNSGTTTANVTLALYDGQGNLLWSGNTESSAIAAGGFIQYLTPFQKYGGRNNIENGYAKVTVNSGSGIIVWASVVDNLTGDPTTIFMKR